MKRVLRIDHEKFFELLDMGLSIEAVAKRMNISVYRAENYRRMHSYQIHKEGEKIDVQLFVKMWNDGMSEKIIAKNFKTTVYMVNYYADKYSDLCCKRHSKEE